MKRSWAWFWILLAILLALATLGALWWWRQSQQTASDACKPSELSLSVGRQEGAAGTTFIHAVLTNKGNRTCTIGGYPTVTLTGAAGVIIGAQAVQNGSLPASAITLWPRDQAYTALGLPQSGNFNPGVCDTTTSTTLKMYLPGTVTSGTVALTTPLAQHVCPGFSVTAFQPGS